LSRKDGYFLKETNPSKNQSPNKLFSNAYEYGVDYNVLHIGFGYLMANYWQTLGYPELNSKCESIVWIRNNTKHDWFKSYIELDVSTDALAVSRKHPSSYQQ
jgi:hypothetical protein